MHFSGREVGEGLEKSMPSSTNGVLYFLDKKPSHYFFFQDLMDPSL